MQFTLIIMYIIGLTLDGWFKDNYYLRQNEVCDKVLKGQDPEFRDTLERIHVDDIDINTFMDKYERGSRPVIIRGVVDNWPARKEWQIKVLIILYNY
jgi:hypothetical protein